MQKRKLTKYEISKRDRLRRVKNQSNRREWLLASIATLLGTAAVIIVGSKLTAKSEDRSHSHATSTQDSGVVGNAHDEMDDLETQKRAFLETCLYFDYLRQYGYSFSESLSIIQGGGVTPKFSDGMMTHRNPQDQSPTRNNNWFKIWCYIGGTLTQLEKEGIPNGCKDIDNTITLGDSDIHRSEIKDYVRDNYDSDYWPIEVVNMIIRSPPPSSATSISPQEVEVSHHDPDFSNMSMTLADARRRGMQDL